jgi:hypothetical protein
MIRRKAVMKTTWFLFVYAMHWLVNLLLAKLSWTSLYTSSSIIWWFSTQTFSQLFIGMQVNQAMRSCPCILLLNSSTTTANYYMVTMSMDKMTMVQRLSTPQQLWCRCDMVVVVLTISPLLSAIVVQLLLVVTMSVVVVADSPSQLPLYKSLTMACLATKDSMG